jgi:Tfp pilus assembly protein PilF
VRSVWAIFFLLAVITLAYFPVFTHSFLGMDDHAYIWDNNMVRQGLTWRGLGWAFGADLLFQTSQADYWQPLTFISRMIDVQIFGMHAGWHHAVSLFLHGLNTLFLYLLLLRLTGQRFLAFAAVLLFAIHPLNSEVVGWVTARKDVLSQGFVLLGLILHTDTRFPRGQRTVLEALCFMAALMSKPTAIVFPLLALLIDLRRGSWRERVLYHGKHFLLLWGIALAYLPIPFLGQPAPFADTLNPPWIKAMTSCVFYVFKVLWPAHCTLYGPEPYQVISHLSVLFSIATIVIISIWTYRARTQEPMLLFGWVWFLITIVPIAGLEWPADRFIYFPKTGIIIIVVWGGDALLSKLSMPWIKTFSVGVIASIFMGLSFVSVKFWKNDQVLMEQVIKTHPNNYAAHNLLGVWYGQRKDLTKAADHLEEALRIFPEREKPWSNLGMVRLSQGQYAEAERCFLRAVELKPNDYKTRVNLANVYITQHDVDKGLYILRDIARLRPDDPDIRNNIRIAEQMKK